MEIFKKYIDKKFASYPKSRSLDELKEELIATLTERYQEYLANGLSQDNAYQTAIQSIGDCKETVNLIESGIDKKTKMLRTKMAVLGGALYWLIVSAIYLTVSLITKKWAYTWTAFPVAAAIFLCAILVIVFPKGRSLGKVLRIRISAMLSFLIATLGIYFLASFFTKEWAITWIIILFGVSLGLIFDSIIIRKKQKTLFIIYIHLIVFLITTTAYHLISYFNIIHWSLSWLIYLFAVIGIIIFNFAQVFLKYKAETSFKK